MNAKKFIAYIIVAAIISVLIGLINHFFIGLNSPVIAAITGTIGAVIVGGGMISNNNKSNK